MIIRLLLVFLVAVFLGALLRLAWLRWQPDPRQLLLAGGVAAGFVALLGLVATGRLHWIAAVVAMVLPVAAKVAGALGMMHLLRRLSGGPTPFPGGPTGGGARASEVRTQFLHMELDHERGRLEGRIVDGPHAGKRLDELSSEELVALHAHYQRQDPDSARLLETWLDRTQGPHWRQATTGDDDGPMSRAQALRVLGLSGQPSREEIIRAHRRMMQKFHPDHGGSDDLAARINAAKARLLDDLEP